MVSSWPKINYDSKKVGDKFEIIKDIIVAIREARTSNKIEPKVKVTALFSTKSKKIRELLEKKCYN